MTDLEIAAEFMCLDQGPTPIEYPARDAFLASQAMPCNTACVCEHVMEGQSNKFDCPQCGRPLAWSIG